MFKIVKDTNPNLRKRSVEVELPLSKENRELLLKMSEHLEQSQNEEYATKHHLREGVGIAAPQVGHNIRMIGLYYPKDDGYVKYGLVNPIILSSSLRQCALKSGEGCLSVDLDHAGYVYRSFKIVVKAYDIYQDKDVTITARGFDAIVLQHEIDHLNGVLFYDHIDPANPFKEIEGSVKI